MPMVLKFPGPQLKHYSKIEKGIKTNNKASVYYREFSVVTEINSTKSIVLRELSDVWQDWTAQLNPFELFQSVV